MTDVLEIVGEQPILLIAKETPMEKPHYVAIVQGIPSNPQSSGMYYERVLPMLQHVASVSICNCLWYTTWSVPGTVLSWFLHLLLET